MKRIIVLTILVLLVGSTLFAADIAWSGKVKYGFIGNLSSVGRFGETIEGSLKAAVTIDDFNTAALKVKSNADATVVFDEASLTTAIGKALGLEDSGVKIATTVGYFEPGMNKYYKLTGNETEDVASTNAGKDWSYAVVLTIADVVNVKIAEGVNPSERDFLAGVYGVVGPVSLEVFYSQEGMKKFGDGAILANGKFETQVMEGATLSVGVGIAYILLDLQDLAPQYTLGAAVKFAMAPFTFAVGMAGEQDNIVQFLDPEFDFAISDTTGLDLAAALDLYKDAPNTINMIEVSAYWKPGKALFRVGYEYAPDDAGEAPRNWKAPASITEGGIFARLECEF